MNLGNLIVEFSFLIILFFLGVVRESNDVVEGVRIFLEFMFLGLCFLKMLLVFGIVL